MPEGLSDLLASITGTTGSTGEEIQPANLGTLRPRDGEQFTPISHTAVTIAQTGCYPNGKEFIVYNFKRDNHDFDDPDCMFGTWSELPYDRFRINASILHAQLQGLSFDELRSLTTRDMDHIITKIAACNGAQNFKPMPNRRIHDKYNLEDGYIPFNNGVYLFSTKELVPHEKDWHLVSKIKHDYKPESGEPVNYLHMLDNISGGRSDVKEVLTAASLLALSGRHKTQQTSILHLFSSQGGTGKSTFIDCLSQIAGQDRVHTLSIKDLTDPSAIYPIRKSSLVLFTDEREPIIVNKHGGVLLKMATADYIAGRVAYSPSPYNIKCNALIVMASNTAILPPTDSGLNRRTLVIVVPPIKGKKDFNIMTKLEEEVPQIISYLLRKYSSIKEASDVFRNAKNELVFNSFAQEVTGQSSNIALFVDSLWEIIPDKMYNPDDAYQNPMVQTVYNTYRQWLLDNNPGSSPMSRQRFINEMRTQCADFYGKIDIGPSKKPRDGWISPHAQRFCGMKPKLKSADVTPAIQQTLAKEYAL